MADIIRAFSLLLAVKGSEHSLGLCCCAICQPQVNRTGGLINPELAKAKKEAAVDERIKSRWEGVQWARDRRISTKSLHHDLRRGRCKPP